ncbi:MAG: OmpA family protein [Bacteroidia bacterium]|nr:OmpA family protein [Bacteroidia bacterium]
MGAGVNSEGRELFYREYPVLGYAVYSGTNNSDEYSDIKVFVPGKPMLIDSTHTVVLARVDTVSRIVEINYGAADNAAAKIVTIYGKVTNSKTGEPVVAHISFNGPTFDNAATTSVPDGYSVKIPSTEEYRVKIEAPGFVSTMEKLDIQTYEMKTLEMNFKLQPVERGTTVNLKSVLFERGTSNLLEDSFPELDLVVEFLNKNPNVKIELAGHTDNRGIQSHNVRLSQLRVERVREYLVSKGIVANRVTGKGYGGSKPIASNEAEETRQLNRRVEFIIKKF